MSDEETLEVIQLVKCNPQLEMNLIARNILFERFESPISIIVYMGHLGAGKSKLASLTLATLSKEITDLTLLPFKSGDDPKGCTHGVWMATQPLKNPKKKRGSILILDCEGMGGNDTKTSNNLYLFCMIVSSIMALVLRPARIDREQCGRLYEELRRFQRMQSPCVLPFAWLVPLELPFLICDDKEVTSKQWIEKVFTVDDPNENLTTAQKQELQARYDLIQQMLPNIDVANLTYLPNDLKRPDISLSAMQTILKDKSSKNYCVSLNKMHEKFLNVQGKRLPGSNCIPALLVRPVELGLFMTDLIDVINQNKEPNPDELIGRCLLKRFKDEIVKQIKEEFRKELLDKTTKYLREKIDNQDTKFELDEFERMLQQERHSLIEKYINKLISSATKKIYGSNSVLLSSISFQECLNEARMDFNSYRDPKELFEKVKEIYRNTTDQKAQKEQEHILSKEMDDKLATVADRICREEKINQAIQEEELKCEVERCQKCHRHAGVISMIHQCTTRLQGNLYRYDKYRMVCSECRILTNIDAKDVSCTSCGFKRTIINHVN